ncbi:MAG: amidohydrolase family protein, partial [Selenomonadaceae bacterium]
LVDACEVAAKNANVAIDVSGLLEGKPKPLVLFEHQAGFWRQLHTWLSYMGDFSRVMYGSDWPLVNIPLYIRMISYIIPEQHYEAVFYENALRIFPKIGALL